MSILIMTPEEMMSGDRTENPFQRFVDDAIDRAMRELSIPNNTFVTMKLRITPGNKNEPDGRYSPGDPPANFHATRKTPKYVRSDGTLPSGKRRKGTDGPDCTETGGHPSPLRGGSTL